jgi:hypothetical protein
LPLDVMRILVLSCSLAVLAPAAVTAAPDREEISERVRYADEPRADPASSDAAWVELASPTPARHGRVYLPLAPGARYTQLRLEAHAGRPRVQSVRLAFRDGEERVVRVARVLATERPAVIDLDGTRELDFVVVVTDPRGRATYTVHAAPTAIPSTGRQ